MLAGARRSYGDYYAKSAWAKVWAAGQMWIAALLASANLAESDDSRCCFVLVRRVAPARSVTGATEAETFHPHPCTLGCEEWSFHAAEERSWSSIFVSLVKSASASGSIII